MSIRYSKKNEDRISQILEANGFKLEKTIENGRVVEYRALRENGTIVEQFSTFQELAKWSSPKRKNGRNKGSF